MLDDESWPLVVMLVIGLAIGGYFGTTHGQKFEIEKYCKWKYEKYVDVEKCLLKPDYWKKLDVRN